MSCLSCHMPCNYVPIHSCVILYNNFMGPILLVAVTNSSYLSTVSANTSHGPTNVHGILPGCWLVDSAPALGTWRLYSVTATASPTHSSYSSKLLVHPHVFTAVNVLYSCFSSARILLSSGYCLWMVYVGGWVSSRGEWRLEWHLCSQVSGNIAREVLSSLHAYHRNITYIWDYL